MLITTSGLLPRPTAQAQVDASYVPALVIFGKDENGRSHASSFAEGDLALATKPASLMGMRILQVKTDEQRDLAVLVPHGKVFGSGKAFLPFIKANLFDAIEAIAPTNSASTSSESQLPEPAGSAANEIDAANMIEAAKLLIETTPTVPQPTGWGDIQVGAIVLSAARPDEMDFFECVVLSAEGDDRYELRYCDWPDEASFTHHVSSIGLLHPSRQPEPPLEAGQPTAAA